MRNGCFASMPRRYTVSMCASSRIFFVPLPSKRAWTIFPMRALHAVSVRGRIDQLDLTAQRPQAGCDQLGGAIQALEVAAAGLDRDQILQRVEERGPLLFREREHRLQRLRGGETRRGDRK